METNPYYWNGDNLMMGERVVATVRDFPSLHRMQRLNKKRCERIYHRRKR